MTLRRRGSRLTVVVSDGARKVGSGLRRDAVRIAFGDRSGAASASRAKRGRRHGKKAAPVVRESHEYARPGRYRVRVQARDKAGNRRRFQRIVRIG